MLAHDNGEINKIYNVGIYLRLSKEDETVGQSESIENQKNFITKYVLEQNWNIIDIFIDDGFSGLNFNRPGFKSMLSAIESKKINLVITKDLSRLGRDYIDTGYYIERYFPSKNVRYIAINDGIDTFSNNSNNDMSPFKSVINDMYAKDISKKVRSVMDSKRQNGEFIGAFAPYGYMKDPNNKNKFVIDPVVAPIVQRIYSLYIEGFSMGGITKVLNNEGVPCPSKYKQSTSTYKNAMIKRYIWGQETIKRILTNPSYMGCMTQRRQEKINYKVDKFKKIPRSDWISIEGTHEPIIEPDTFQLVQEIIEKKTVRYARGKDTFHLLNGLLFCKDCGAKMTFRRNCTKKMVMNCMTYSKWGPTHCQSHTMNEKLVDEYVINDLRRIAKLALNDDFFDEFKYLKFPKSDNNIAEKIQQIEIRFSEIRDIIKTLYEDKVRGIISESDFLEMTKEYSEEKDNLSFQYKELKQELETQARPEVNYIDLLKQIAHFEVIEKSILVRLIDKIEITKDKEIIIYYTFQNPVKTACT